MRITERVPEKQKKPDAGDVRSSEVTRFTIRKRCSVIGITKLQALHVATEIVEVVQSENAGIWERDDKTMRRQVH